MAAPAPLTPLAPGARITGPQRQQVAAAVVEHYQAGESIRSMADALGRSYGWVQGLLRESGVSLRARGGATRGVAAANRRSGSPASSSVATLPLEGDPAPGNKMDPAAVDQVQADAASSDGDASGPAAPRTEDDPAEPKTKTVKKTTKSGKVAKGEKSEKFTKKSKVGKAEKSAKQAKTEKAEKPAKKLKAEKPDKSAKVKTVEKPEKSAKKPKAEKSEKSVKKAKADKAKKSAKKSKKPKKG